MGLTGKYNFKGIKKMGSAGIRIALLSSPQTAWMTKIPLLDLWIGLAVNWLANNGLILLNIGAIIVNGEVDQKLLDRALENGIKEVENQGAKLSPERAKEIDDAVIRAADRALPYG